MKVNRKEFKKALSLVSKIVEAKNTLPILGYVLLSARGKSLLLVATDLEVALATTIPADSKDEMWDVAIPPKALRPVINSGEDDVDIEAIGTSRLRVNSITLDGLLAADYPNIPPMSAEASKGQSVDLPGAVAKALHAVTADEMRFAISGMLFAPSHASEKTGHAVGTDSHHMVVADAPDFVADAPPFIVPRKACAILAGFEGPIIFAQDGSHAWFSAGETMLLTRKTQGTFPNYRRVIPPDKVRDKATGKDTTENWARCTVALDSGDRLSIISALKSLPDISGPGSQNRPHPVEVTLNKTIRLEVDIPDVGKGEKILPIPAKLADSLKAMHVRLDRRYLADALGLPVTEMRLRDGDTQVHFRGPGVEVVIMPMRPLDKQKK